jgi:hypothetical protein
MGLPGTATVRLSARRRRSADVVSVRVGPTSMTTTLDRLGGVPWHAGRRTDAQRNPRVPIPEGRGRFVITGSSCCNLAR